MLPQRSTTSRWTVSPRVGSPAPGVRRRRRRQPPHSRLVVVGRVVRDEGAALVVVVLREQRLEWHLGVAVERVAVGEGELRALGHDVDSSAGESSARSKPSSSASCCRPTGPARKRLADEAAVPRAWRPARATLATRPCRRLRGGRPRRRRNGRSPRRRTPRTTRDGLSRSHPRAIRPVTRRGCAGRSPRAPGYGRSCGPRAGGTGRGRPASRRAARRFGRSWPGCRRRSETRAPRRPRTRARPRAGACRTARAGATPPKAPGAAASRPGDSSCRAPGSARSWRPPAPRPGRRARPAHRARRARGAGPRPGRSDAARRPGA